MRAADGAAVAATESIRAVRVTAVVLCVAGAGVVGWEFYRAVVVFPGGGLLAAGLELPLLVLGGWLLRLLRPVRAPSWRWSAAAVTWGATAATGCALLANQGLTSLWAKTTGIGFASNWSAALTAPLNEEVLKLCGVIMIVLAAPQVIRGPLDGMIYGGLTGLGFELTENVMYGLNNISQTGAIDPDRAVASSAALRAGLTAPGSHWTMTAVAGAGIGYLAARGLRSGAAPALGCMAAAMTMHLVFDAPQPAIVVKVAVNFAVAAGLYLFLRRGYLARARMAVSTRAAWGDITDAEAAILLSRYGRWLERRRAQPGTERDYLRSRQQTALASVEQEAS